MKNEKEGSHPVPSLHPSLEHLLIRNSVGSTIGWWSPERIFRWRGAWRRRWMGTHGSSTYTPQSVLWIYISISSHSLVWCLFRHMEIVLVWRKHKNFLPSKTYSWCLFSLSVCCYNAPVHSLNIWMNGSLSITINLRLLLKPRSFVECAWIK